MEGIFYCDLIVKFLHTWNIIEVKNKYVDAWLWVFGNVLGLSLLCCRFRTCWLSNPSSADGVISQKGPLCIRIMSALYEHYTINLFKCLFTTNVYQRHLYRVFGIIFAPVPVCSRQKRMDFDHLSNRKWQDSGRQKTASGHLRDRWLPPPTLPHL